MDDESFSKVIYPMETGEESERAEEFSEQSAYWLKELRRVGVTRQLLWEEYRAAHPRAMATASFVNG